MYEYPHRKGVGETLRFPRIGRQGGHKADRQKPRVSGEQARSEQSERQPKAGEGERIVN